MAQISIQKVSALPATKAPNTLYIVKSAEAGLIDIYVTGTDAAEVRHVFNKAEINSAIASAVSSFSNLNVVVDIAARDAMTPDRVMLVLVKDATADTTVKAGGASYVYEPATTTWTKIAEYESMDLSLTWAGLEGKPTSAVADIDDAVTKRHSHANKVELDKITEDGNGEMLYNGLHIRARLDVAEW